MVTCGLRLHHRQCASETSQPVGRCTRREKLRTEETVGRKHVAGVEGEGWGGRVENGRVSEMGGGWVGGYRAMGGRGEVWCKVNGEAVLASDTASKNRGGLKSCFRSLFPVHVYLALQRLVCLCG